MSIRLRSLVLVALILAIPTFGQASRLEVGVTFDGPRVETVYFKSRLMDRQMPYRVVLPRTYYDKGSGGRMFPVIYLLHGLTGRFDNWTNLSDVVGHSADQDVIIVTPEGENGWYTDNLVKANAYYESYLIKELIPEVEKRYRVNARRDQRAIAGLSMGGYGAIKFGLKYPELFAIVGSFSGAISAANITEINFPGNIGKSVDAILGPPGGETRKANDAFDIIRRATPEKIKSFPFIYLDCGTEDLFFQSNREFAGLLLEKKISHEYRQLPGGHNWKYWDKQVDEFLDLANRKF